MAKVWGTVLAGRAAAWNIPPADVTELGTVTAAAQNALDAALNAGRSQIANAECRAAFDALEVKMRYLKKHYL